MGRVREICLVLLAGFIFQFGYMSEARICPPKSDKGVIEGVGNTGGSVGSNVDMNTNTRKPIDKPLSPQQNAEDLARARQKAETDERAARKAEEEAIGIQKAMEEAKKKAKEEEQARLKAEEDERQKAEEEEQAKREAEKLAEELRALSKGQRAGDSAQPPGQTTAGGNIADRFAKRERDRSDYRQGREVADASRPVAPPQPPVGVGPSEPSTSTPPTPGRTVPPTTPGGTGSTTTPSGRTTTSGTTLSPSSTTGVSGSSKPPPTTSSTTPSTGSVKPVTDESKWYVWYTGAPGVWCKLTMSKDTKEYMEKKKRTVVVGPCNTQQEALQRLCGMMSNINYAGGETNVYPGVKAKVGGNIFDVGGFVYYDNNSKKYICRQQ